MISFLKPASKAAIALASIYVPAQASAGEIGPSSRATINISLSIAPRIDVRLVSDAALAGTKTNWVPQGQAICISASTATRAYGVSLLTSPAETATGQGYLVEWIDEPQKSAGAQIRPGSTVMGFVASQGLCTGQSRPSARMFIRSLPGTSVENLPAAATLLIIPE